jgi:hypothetical protein
MHHLFHSVLSSFSRSMWHHTCNVSAQPWSCGFWFIYLPCGVCAVCSHMHSHSSNCRDPSAKNRQVTAAFEVCMVVGVNLYYKFIIMWLENTWCVKLEPEVDCSNYFLYVLCMIFHNSCHLYMDVYTYFPIKELWKKHKSCITVKVNQTLGAID